MELVPTTNTVRTSRRVVLEDIQPGAKIVRANVGKYLGPSFEPRITVIEKILTLTGPESPIEDGFVYLTSASGHSGMVSLKEMLAGKDVSDSLRITYWTYPL